MEPVAEDVLVSEDEGWHCPICGFEGASEFVVFGHIGAKHIRKVKPIRHGTVAGYKAELRRGMRTCPACRTAWRRYFAALKALRGRQK